ncbi:helix-turn-helix domain-containing protein [Pseudomonas sp. NyZ201]|uniref:helix-turn-helix domain-containing protein n=1 Tax=Pseudomonas sp. NyZ201 TaxID=3409857 RepID=UPI003CE736DE
MDKSHEDDQNNHLAAHGQRILDSGALGKSRQTLRLFELLLERSLSGAATKEVEIAQIVFGKSIDADLAADATVRVHVHRLRKKLDDLPADAHGERLVLPRGEYRLVVAVAQAQGAAPGLARRTLRAWPYLACAACVLLNALGWFWLTGDTADARVQSVLWRGLSDDANPVLVVSGDFFVFGEQGADGRVQRMIADPAIASSEALSQYLQKAPPAAHYVDMNTSHLPNGLASALVSVTPIVAATRPGKPGLIKQVTTSRFTNEMLSAHDIVYVGLLDTLGELQEPFFDACGFALSPGGDTLIDLNSASRFQSDWDEPTTDRIMRRDYAYLARFPGPAGNQVVMVAGLMDPALVEASKIAADRAALERLQAQLGDSQAFVALYEVRTFGPSNVSAQLLMVRPLDVTRMWRAGGASSTAGEPDSSAQGAAGTAP